MPRSGPKMRRTAKASLIPPLRRKKKPNKRTLRRRRQAWRDGVIMYADTRRRLERTHTHAHSTLCTAQVLYGKFQNLTQETQQNRSSSFWKAHRFSHLANDIQRETSGQAHSKYACRRQGARDIKRHRPQEDDRWYDESHSIISRSSRRILTRSS